MRAWARAVVSVDAFFHLGLIDGGGLPHVNRVLVIQHGIAIFIACRRPTSLPRLTVTIRIFEFEWRRKPEQERFFDPLQFIHLQISSGKLPALLNGPPAARTPCYRGVLFGIHSKLRRRKY
jgi:hypothetical protein